MQNFTINFTKTFIKGNLKGITIQDKLSYCSFGGAENWVEGVKRGVQKGLFNFTLDYAVIHEAGKGVVLAWTRWDK